MAKEREVLEINNHETFSEFKERIKNRVDYLKFFYSVTVTKIGNWKGFKPLEFKYKVVIRCYKQVKKEK